MTTWETFQRLSERGNFIPVYGVLPADVDTPVSAWYRVCCGQPYSFLLESVEGASASDVIACWGVTRCGC